MAKISVWEAKKGPSEPPFLTPNLVTPKDIDIKGEKTCPDDRSTIMQTLTSIGRTVAEIAVPGQRHTDDIYDKTLTSVAFVV